tara:strand:- start:35331 stop:35927 length:597 start_codon:yes stop_codon:yes gene_type:complete
MSNFNTRLFYKKLKLIEAPHKVLTTKLKDFDYELYDAPQLSVEMIDNMLFHAGRGLSANQLNLDARIFVMQRSSGEFVTAINPKILSKSKSIQADTEGCLSYPNLFLEISRPKSVEVEYYDENQNKRQELLYGIDARCFQHELDHLNGVVFTSKVSSLKIQRAKNRMKKYSKNNYTINNIDIMGINDGTGFKKRIRKI